MTDTSKDETVVVGDSKTTGTTPTTPITPVVEDKPSDNAVEELRLLLEKAKLRENQLANQLKAEQDAKEAAKAKELEEQNQFKDLYEQEKVKREALETEQETKEKQAELDKVKQETLSGFSDEVKTLAEEVGLELSETDDKSVELFKGKLEKISLAASANAKITANNPNQSESNVELNTDQLREALGSDQGFHDLVTKKFPVIASMTSPRK